MHWSSIHFLQISEHVTFRIENSEGEKFLLRIHPGSKSRAETVSELEWLEPTGSNYGLIHADLHNGNVVFRDDEPYAIDFGRCGFGYHLYDIAQSIMGLLPPHRELFIKGYEQVRKMDENSIPILESFFIMAIIEAYSFHAEISIETEDLIEEQPYAQAILRAYMDEVPFMFQPLDEVSLS